MRSKRLGIALAIKLRRRENVSIVFLCPCQVVRILTPNFTMPFGLAVAISQFAFIFEHKSERNGWINGGVAVVGGEFIAAKW